MSTSPTPEFNALSLGESSLFEILEQYCQAANADAVNAAQSLGQVIPQANFALLILANAPMVLRTSLLTLLASRYDLYLGPVACHHRRIAHISTLSSIGFPNTQADQRRQAEEFIQLHYPYSGGTTHEYIMNLLALMGPSHQTEYRYGGGGYRHDYFHYSRTGPDALGERLLKRLSDLEPNVAADVVEGSCPEGSWAESVTGFSHQRSSVRGGLTVCLNREGSMSHTTVRFELDYTGDKREYALRSWSHSNSQVFNAMESVSYGGSARNIDIMALHRVLLHYLQTVEPTLSLETFSAYSPSKSPYTEVYFTAPELILAFFQDESKPWHIPFKSSRFSFYKVRYSPVNVPYGTTPFIRIQREGAGDPVSISIKVDGWLELVWEDPTNQVIRIKEGRREEGTLAVFGTPEGIEVVQKAITEAMEEYVHACVEHQAVLEQLTKIDELSNDELSELVKALDSTPFIPVDSYDSTTNWRLGGHYGYD